jgi:hypothetical protein
MGCKCYRIGRESSTTCSAWTGSFPSSSHTYWTARVFQNFVDKLGNFYNNDRPIRRARCSLRQYQVNAIENAMTGYNTSCAPHLFLPSSLQGEAASKRGMDHGTAKKSGPKTEADHSRTSRVAQLGAGYNFGGCIVVSSSELGVRVGPGCTLEKQRHVLHTSYGSLWF